MWIRSQSKKALLNVSSIHILKDGDMSLMCCVVAGCDYELGVYSTEEKALKVLDEIQRKIECPDSSLISPAASINYYHLSARGHFYQMPQDEDVEV